MRRGHAIRKCVLLLVAAAGAAAAAAYLLASRVPGDYRPARLSSEDRDVAMRQFRRRLMDFNTEGQRNQEFTWSLGEEEINRYLESMDEIAVEQGAKPGTVHRALQKAGLGDLSVSLADGVVRFMARSTRHQKIISVGVRFVFDRDGKLYVRMAGVRLGQLPVPKSLVQDKLGKLTGAMARANVKAGSQPRGGGAPPEEVEEFLRRVLAAIDGGPVETELSWRISTRKRVRIDRIDVEGGRLTLHAVPVAAGGGK